MTTAKTYNIKVSPASQGIRLDRYLTTELQALWQDEETLSPTRSKIARWIELGAVSINRRTEKHAGKIVSAGMQIELAVPQERDLKLTPSAEVDFEIVFEDDEVLVIDKPAGLVVHPGAGTRGPTLVEGIAHYLGDKLQQIGDALRPGIVHRLDKDTSGLIVVAKTERSYQNLLGQFKPPRTIRRSYLAVTAALPRPVRAKRGDAGSGLIELPIGRDPRERTRMKVTDLGRPAATRWREVEGLSFGHLLELTLETGRTHQIRVHLQACGAPIIGDKTYGPRERELPKHVQAASKALGRQALHAVELSFFHPSRGEEMKFASTLPVDFDELLMKLRGRPT